MSTLRVEELTKAYGIRNIFTGVSFELRRGEKAGLIGANGTGKTTLLRCLLEIEAADSGKAAMPPGSAVGYVEQDQVFSGTLREFLLSAYQDVIDWQERMRRLEAAIAAERDEAALAEMMKEYAAAMERFERGGGYSFENIVRRVANGLGFGDDDFDRDIATFSGGQKTRINLAKALVRQPDFLFLDEPTNHLDITMTEWLEEFLREYPGGVLVISHDRFFLDRVTTKILELENGGLEVYRGSYSEYLGQKAERVAAQRAAYEKQQDYIAKTEAYIDRYRAGIKAKQARGRQSLLDRLERLDAPAEADEFDLRFPPAAECAERVAELIRVEAAYGDKKVLDGVSLLVRRGEGVALVGPNGAGKTTLLKLLTGDVQPRRGAVKLGNRVTLGYFSQEHEGLDLAGRVIDEIMAEHGFGEERARQYLGAFLFGGDDVYKLVGDLSGGEKARLVLLKLMLGGANFLVLDEPTNHLDIAAKEAVEAAIVAYPGTFLVVSHDRYFLDKVADRVVELAEGRLTEYAGNYSYYREKKQLLQKQAAQRPAAKAPKKPAERPRRPRDTAKLAKKLEMEIAALEAAVAETEIKLNDPASHQDPEVSRTLSDEYALLQAELAAKYDEWLELVGEK